MQKKKFLREIENYFLHGESIVKIIHGMGKLELKKMILEEVEKLEYLKLANNQYIFPNYGVTFIRVLAPDKSLLKKYIL